LLEIALHSGQSRDVAQVNAVIQTAKRPLRQVGDVPLD
jgi:hypothetical protein